MRRILELVAMVFLAAGCSLLPGPVVRIDGGVSPRMTADQVARMVVDRIHQMEQAARRVETPAHILSITATTAEGIARLEPNSGRADPPAPGVQWLVRAEGTFMNSRTPPGAKPMLAASGYFVIGDGDGEVVSFGFP